MHEYLGIQFIGDPHISSKRPGRRSDDYAASVLAKLEFCAQESIDRQLKTVILGDLFHSAGENNLTVLNRLFRALRSFYGEVLVLIGNHDKALFEISDKDALRLVFTAGVAAPLDETPCDVRIAGSLVRLIGAGHGSPIPSVVDRGNADVVCLVTHHDLAFGGAYPGSQEIKEVKGADFCVNGHMHDTKESVQAGGTLWHCPGNIEPLSVDLRHFVPGYWTWSPLQASYLLQKTNIPHNFDCFDLTGIAIDASEDALGAVKSGLGRGENPEEIEARGEGAISTAPGEFATALAAQDTLAADRTDDGSIIAQDLAQVLEDSQASEATAYLLQALLDRVKAKSFA